MSTNYAYLDQDEFRSIYGGAKNSRHMKFFIEGVRCGKCVQKIENLKLQNSEICNLEMNLANQTADIELTNEKSSFARIADAIQALGFRAVPIRVEEDESSHWQKEIRSDLARLGVAGFCASQIMMLAFAGYFGDLGYLKSPFQWFQFALYLPVVTYVALPFYRGFIGGIRNRSLSIDGPMAVASFLGFAVSTWNLFRDQGSIYFDSTSGFLFLILATRFWQKRTRFEAFRYLRPSALAETVKARLIQTAGWQWVPSAQLKPQDEIQVQKNEWIPADGELLDFEAVVDLSVLSGESFPRRVQKGFRLQAGSKLLSAGARIRVTKSGSQTLLSHLLSSLKKESLSETEGARISDRASQILLALVLGGAFLILVSGFFTSFEAQFEKAFALIILACPCAMAFGTPLAYAFAMKRAQEEGIVLKSARTLDRLQKVKNLFLDKTGTLTESQWQISNSSLPVGIEPLKKVILLLESKSSHPVAFALRGLWWDVSLEGGYEVANLIETPSKGVRGTIDGVEWDFHSYALHDGEKFYGLWRKGVLVWQFQLQARLQVGAKESVQALENRGLQISLLSGDAQAETLKTAEALGVPAEKAFSNLSPVQKQEKLMQASQSIMIGDGVNDSLALQAADIGIAVSGSVDVALRAADVLFLNPGLSSLEKLFAISASAQKQIRRNLWIALVYNGLGASLAVMGLVNPFIAALLMPASSMVIWSSTWWGMRK